MRVCVISGVIKDSKVLQALSASFAQACEFYVCNAEWVIPVPGLGPELCHDRGLALPHPCVAVALGVPSVIDLVTGLGRVYEITPLANITVNRHQSGISSLESYRTSKYPQLLMGSGMSPRLASVAVITRGRTSRKWGFAGSRPSISRLQEAGPRKGPYNRLK